MSDIKYTEVTITKRGGEVVVITNYVDGKLKENFDLEKEIEKEVLSARVLEKPNRIDSSGVTN